VIDEFVNKLLHEIMDGNVTSAIMLTHAFTDTAWWHAAAKASSAGCFPRGRLKFTSPTGKIARPVRGQCVLYFGSELERFFTAFRRFGGCVRAGLRTARPRG
jgi:hypothetical protein